MDRRTFIAAALGATAVWRPAHGQQGTVHRIGYVALNEAFAPRVEAFRAALRELGYVEGQNLVLRVGYAGHQLERLDAVMGSIAQDVHVLVTSFSAAAREAKRRAIPIPVVTAGVADPVGSGLVDSLSRPGGNITGVTLDASTETGAKRAELFREMVPHMKRLAVLWNVDDPGMPQYVRPVETWARTAGVDMQIVGARTEADLAAALSRIAKSRPDALFVVPTSVIATQYRTVLAFAAKHRLPTSGAVRWFTEAGALMSYTVDERALDGRAAHFVDRILKGTRPADLPMEQPTKFDLVINLKTARALGVTVPPSLLLRADHVIE